MPLFFLLSVICIPFVVFWVVTYPKEFKNTLLLQYRETFGDIFAFVGLWAVILIPVVTLISLLMEG